MGKGGDTGEGPLASDPMFAPFLAEHFDAMEYASTSLSSSSATAQVDHAIIARHHHMPCFKLPSSVRYPSSMRCHALCHAQAKTAQLQQGIKLLDDRISAEVQLRQETLLQQAESLREAQAFMQARKP